MGSKKIVVVFLAVVVAALSFAGTSHAQMSPADKQSIQKQLDGLIAELQALQSRMVVEEPTIPPSIPPTVPAPIPLPPTDPLGSFCYTFDENLKIGDRGKAVTALHTVLGMEGFTIPSDEKDGSRFSEGTASAVTGFQQKYASEILTPLGLSYGTGFVGKGTRAKLNALYGCGTQPGAGGASALPDLNAGVPKVGTGVFEAMVCVNGRVDVSQFDYEFVVAGQTKGIQQYNGSPVAFGRCATVSSFPFGQYGISSYWDGNVRISVDPSNRLAESNEKNNTVEKLITFGDVPSGYPVVISPNGGEVLKKGSSYNVAWKQRGAQSVNFVLNRKSGGSFGYNEAGFPQYKVAVQTEPNFQWRVPETLPDGDDYVFCVANSYAGYQSDCSDEPFSIVGSGTTQPSITVLSPNGGEMYRIGDDFQIKWRASNFPSGATAYIELRPAGYIPGAVFGKIAIASPTSGYYSWRVPSNIVPGQYIVEIYKADQNGNIDPSESTKDISDAPFSIVSGTSTNKPDLTVHDIYNDGGKLSVKIGNIGDIAAPANTGHLYIWIDGQLRWTYSLGTLYDQSFLQPGGSMVGQPQILSGTHVIKAYIDPNNAIAESNENNNILEKTVDFSVAVTPITIKTSSNLSGTVGAYFNAVFDAFGGTPGYTFSVTAGSLPPGLSLFPLLPPITCGGTTTSAGSQCVPYEITSVSLQGTPTQAGSYKFTIAARDKIGATGSETFIVTIGGVGTTGIDLSLENVKLPTASSVGNEFVLSFDIFNRGTAIFDGSSNYGGKGVQWSVNVKDQGGSGSSRIISNGCSVSIVMVPGAGCSVSMGIIYNSAGTKGITIDADYANIVPELNEGNNSVTPTITITSGTNLPPVISGLTAPSTLAVGETGTWTVTASDPENGALSYRVVWGDEATISAATLQMQQPSSQTAQEATFTHAYSQAGTYTPTFTVTDSAGLSARTSASVNVSGSTYPPSLTKIWVTYPNDGGTFYKGNPYTITWSGVGLSSAVNILLYKSSASASIIAFGVSSAANGGSYRWTVPSTLQDGSDYKIVAVDSSSGVQDYSDFPFTIASPPTVIRKVDFSAGYIKAGADWFIIGVCNNGTEKAVTFDFKIDANGKSAILASSQGIAPGECMEAPTYRPYKDVGITPPWEGTVEVTVDPYNKYQESDEANNYIKAYLIVSGTQPPVSAPQIRSTSITSGPPGTVITIYGNGFIGSNTVCFAVNGVCYKVDVSTRDSSTLFTLVPSSVPPGVAMITVSNANGTSNGVSFTVSAPPTTAMPIPQLSASVNAALYAQVQQLQLILQKLLEQVGP